MKKIIVLLMTCMLCACTPSAGEKKLPIMPKELEDCRVYTISDGVLNTYTVFRCPNSTTTTQYTQGKTNVRIVMVDGVEYQEVKK